MTNLRLILASMALGALICGFVGALAAAGTSVLLPGVGLIIAGPLFGGLMGAILGSLLGLAAAAVIIFVRRRNYP